MSIYVMKAGLLTTVQDLGRQGYQKFGIIASGAMDSFALRAANLLVGNDEQEAALEITLVGPQLRFEADAVISICGGDLSPTINGSPVPMWKGVAIRAGSALRFGPVKHGIRSYLSIAGGFALPEIMGSRSTYLRAKLGGFHGRALQSGDILALREPEEAVTTKRNNELAKNIDFPFITVTNPVLRHIIPPYSQTPIIRVLKGQQYDRFTKESQQAFVTDRFKVSPQSDRMGYRLSGTPLELKQAEELLSEAVTFGTVQVPSDGQPIVLMADRQTTGGYPKIAQVISVDLPIMAQLNLGAEIKFEEVTLKQAQKLHLQREYDLFMLKHGSRLQYN